jgi:type IX secretion system PorP/SprF family membrane protein
MLQQGHISKKIQSDPDQMKTRILTLYLVWILTGIKPVNAQDIHFSQWSRMGILYNPAAAGHFDGDIRSGGIYRSQWSSVTVPYRTAAFFIDAPVSSFKEKLPKNLGAGVLIHHDVAGDGILRRLSARLSVSYRKSLNSDSIHFFSGGVSWGFGHRNIDFSRLRFDNQFDGDAFDPAALSGENFVSPTTTWNDLGFGFSWERLGESTNWIFGLGMLHLNRPKDPFAGGNERRPVLSQYNLAVQHDLTDNIRLIPQMSVMLQSGAAEYLIGTEVRMLQGENTLQSTAAGLAIHYRLKDAIVPALYLYRGKFSYAISYDINVSDLRNASNSRGGPEISIIYSSRKIKPDTQRRVICPVY